MSIETKLLHMNTLGFQHTQFAAKKYSEKPQIKVVNFKEYCSETGMPLSIDLKAVFSLIGWKLFSQNVQVLNVEFNQGLQV